MKSATAFGVLALAASVVAHEHQHEKFHHRGLDTADCKVSYHTVTSYGEWGLVPASVPPSSSSSSTSSSSSSSAAPTSTSTSTSSSSSAAPTSTSTSSSAPPPPPPSTSSSSPPPPPTTTSTPAPVTTSEAPIYQYKAAITTSEAPAAPAPAPATSSVSSSSSGKSAGVVSNGDKWAFCYTPYTSTGDCKTADQVMSDITSLKSKGFTTIRTYANDCSGLDSIGKACRANGLKMLVGININASGIGGYTDAQIESTKTWGANNWDLVSLVIVGNEAIFNGWATAEGLAGLITHAKSELKGAGYSGDVTTTEPLNVIQAHGSTLCPVVDVIGANMHPYFDNTVLADVAGVFLVAQYAALEAVCAFSKKAYILETGWPTAGAANGKAIAGSTQQTDAIKNIMQHVGGKAAIFSFENDNWKNPGNWGVEQHWGCADLF